MKGLLEFKNLSGEVKDLDMNGRIVTGYLASFDNEDLTGDTIEKGAFTKTLLERKEKIFFLNQHRWAEPHGKFNILEEDKKGLYFESMPLADTSYSNDTLKLYEAGVMNEHSIGFQTVKKRTPRKGQRFLSELKLFEGSNVTMGMNPSTPFMGLKTNMQDINDQAKLIYKALRDGTFTDETFILLEVALKQLQVEAYELGKKSLIEPSGDTQKEPIRVINEFINRLN